MRQFTLSRRHVLRASAQVAVALPWLEAMTGGAGAKAQPAAMNPPRRYVSMFCGVVSGPPDQIRPTATGSNYTLTTPLAALAPVKDGFTVVSGLRLPRQGAGGWGAMGGEWHGSSLGPLVSGVSATGLSAPGVHGDAVARGATSDQIVAAAIAGTTAIRSLELRVQPEVYRENDNSYGVMSYRAPNRPNSPGQPNQPYSSPRLAWQALMTGFVPPNGQEDPTLAALRRSRLSVLDVVRSQSTALQSKLGRADKQRLDRHFEELRELERRTSDQPVPVVRSECRGLMDPGADPATRLVDFGGMFGPAGFSNEHLRGPLMMDLVHMALTCDRTRVSTVLLSFSQSFVAVGPLLNFTGDDFHGTLHGTDATRNGKVLDWHVKQLAYLAKKLRETPEPGTDGGNNVFDRTAMVLQFEGGWDNGDAHTGENMVALVGGGTAGARRMYHGKHIAAAGKHPVSLNVSAMRYAMNSAVAGLGEVQGGLDALEAP
jgi:hypothetical protein